MELNCRLTRTTSSELTPYRVSTKSRTNRASQATTHARTLGLFVATLTLSLSISTQQADADNNWGGIGGGWKSLGGDAVEQPVANAPAPVVATSTSTRTSGPQAIPVSSGATEASGDMGNRALTRAVGSRYANHAIVQAAGIDPREFIIFFEVMIETESAFKTSAHSSAGAIGLAQLMPGTARQLGVDPYDRAQNLDGGVRYLLAQIQEFGTLSLAVAAYNAGPGAVRQYNCLLYTSPSPRDRG